MNSPHQIAEERLQLAGEYARDSELLSDILSQKTALWMQIRETVKSDKSADRVWDGTPLGLGEMRLRMKMKAAEKRMSALKTMLEVLEGEARNQY